ncbi:MAG: glycerol-3-phosphate dehydrogenase/oxidase [Symbiobacterium sp.]|uniref:glycerol-3-phosphate dehydrogenase/oxidase n=1 Tax=Symbiobacterium sp. TaxID=1971213 RepID=UPI003463A8D1
MTVYPFSAAGRTVALQRLAEETFDLLVIGGGITGAGIARDAALRGLRVALVEKDDFGHGTSSRSSKLVHGGLRYLQYGEVRLVRESARERAVLRRIAPHLVHPLPFIFPLFRGDSTAFYRAGLILYDRLAGVTPAEQHRMLDAAAVREWAPGLRDPLTGGIIYGEYITDDARLTMENARSAAEFGAAVANHVRVTGFRFDRERVTGVTLTDALSGETLAASARVVVNATGPWAEQTLSAGSLQAPKHLLLSKGIHLLFPARRLPLAGAVTLRLPDGTMGFAIPRWDYVYVGTTDVQYAGSLDAPDSDPAAVQHLLHLVQECFPEAGLTAGDVISTWAGVRPLIAQEGKAPRDTSRHDEVWRIRPGLITIAGGKLTTYRQMANRVMAHVARELGRSLADSRQTASVPLPGADLNGVRFSDFRDQMFARYDAAGVPARATDRIAWLYGKGMATLLQYGAEDPAWLEPLSPETPALRGEVRLAVEQEMALTLSDFMDRRSALLLFSDDQGEAAAVEAARVMGDLLGWSEERRAAELAAYRKVVRRHRLSREPAGVHTA